MKLKLFKSPKLSTKLSFAYGIIFLLTIVIMNAIILFALNGYMNHASSEQLIGMNDTIHSNLSKQTDLTQFDFADLVKTNENTNIVIYDTTTTYINTGSDTVFPNDQNDTLITQLESGEITVMYLSDTITLDGHTYQIQIIKNMDNERDYFRTLISTMLIIDVFIMLFSILVGWFISKKALSPIDTMTKQAKTISTSNLSKRIKISGPDDELSRLANTFNDLISRLSDAYIIQNQFALNASHELATPLAVVKGYIDLIARWGKEKPEVFEEAVKTIRKELTHMTSLLDSLYEISKTDNELVPIERTSFDMNEIIHHNIKELNLIHPEQRITFEPAEQAILNADAKLMTQMIRALLDNAIKYNRDNLPINILLNQTKKDTIIIIKDQGVGIEKENLPHIFERFYRIDKSRSRSIGGTGLGLAIVKWIIDMHKGTINVLSKVDQGTTFRITLPNDTN